MTTPNKPDRVLRGGYWNDDAYRTRCANRDYGYPDHADNGCGFRAVLKKMTTNNPHPNPNMKIKLTKDANIQFKPVAGIDTLFAETPMTEAQWAFYSGVPCEPTRANYPKVNISWNDVQEMLVKMNELPEDAGGPPAGYEFDFPAEADWEIACMGGSTTEVTATPETAHYNACALAHVKTKAANAFGLYDMLGNVWEWCKDEYTS
jgi:sulfatase modifying factor 1